MLCSLQRAFQFYSKRFSLSGHSLPTVTIWVRNNVFQRYCVIQLCCSTASSLEKHYSSTLFIPMFIMGLGLKPSTCMCGAWKCLASWRREHRALTCPAPSLETDDGHGGEKCPCHWLHQRVLRSVMGLTHQPREAPGSLRVLHSAKYRCSAKADVRLHRFTNALGTRHPGKHCCTSSSSPRIHLD